MFKKILKIFVEYIMPVLQFVYVLWQYFLILSIFIQLFCLYTTIFLLLFLPRFQVWA